MILSSKDTIQEEPETIYQPTVSMTFKQFFFFFLGEKFIWSFRKCIYYLVHIHVNAANQKLIGKLSINFSRSDC